MHRVKTSGSESILAHLDPVLDNLISGWIAVENASNLPLKVTYTSAEGVSTEAFCELPRADAAKVSEAYAKSGFALILETSLSPRAATIDLHIDNYGVISLPLRRQRRVKPAQDSSSGALGAIETVASGRIDGWFYSPDPTAVPVLQVGDRFAEPIDLQKPKARVNALLGLPGDMGFTFAAPSFSATDEIKLFGLTTAGLGLVRKRPAGAEKIEENFFAQIKTAARIASQSGAVGVISWDGAHNPVGRAKVLYDVASTRRPALLITYLFENFGGKIWEPLQSVDMPVLSIPWLARHACHRALRDAGIRFKTLWCCKPRYPTFLLAKVLADPDASLILDFDDNEEHFSLGSSARDKSYGLPTLNLTRQLSDRIPARTAASITLKNDFQAHMVRHARDAADLPVVTPEGPYRVCFIGTVRPHKKVLEAARAIKLFSLTSGVPVEYHVRGDVRPQSLVEELRETGAIVDGKVPMSELQKALSEMDVVLTGFPSRTDSDITTYQITSKIGDALALGKPVLVPEGPSVSDLRDVPGIFLFNEQNFGETLQAALKFENEIRLPREFTLDGAYESFAAAEQQAIGSMRACEALDLLPDVQESALKPAPALLLLWKQPDAGMYGRRVDQVARAYKRKNPNSRIIILELVHESTIENLKKNAQNFGSDHERLLELINLKQSIGVENDGVTLKQIVYRSSAFAADLFDKFLLDNQLTPLNATIIAFPIVQFFEKILPTIQNFPLIVDVVDNQLSWSSKDNSLSRIYQYALLCSASDVVVFNSEENKRFFEERRLMPKGSHSQVIPNWYQLPDGPTMEPVQRFAGLRLFYSGNMKDRIDWDILRRLARIRNDVELHLAGAADFANPEFLALLNYENVIYHGPLSERETLELLRRMDVAVMPHKVDGISTFMNPMKVHMYAAAGVPTVCTDVPGILPSPLLNIANDAGHFLELIETLAAKERCGPASYDGSGPADVYLELIENVRRQGKTNNGVSAISVQAPAKPELGLAQSAAKEPESTSQPAQHCAA